MKNQLNPIFKYSTYLKENDNKVIVRNNKDDDNFIDNYLNKVKKTNLADPIMAASLITPIPGAAIIGNAYTNAYTKRDRSKAYREIVNHPFKSLVKAPIKVPEVAFKTVINVPGTTYDFGKNVVDTLSHPKRTYRRTKKSIKKASDKIKEWHKDKREKEIADE